MKYEFAPDLQYIADEISKMLFPHIKIGFFRCLRSYGSSSRDTIARCHALGKLMQKAMGVPAFYAIEFLHENFDTLPEDEKVKVIIHELMHIPKSFGGGFRHHDYVCEKNIDMYYQKYENMKRAQEEADLYEEKDILETKERQRNFFDY
jgi:predicted metallopeptidase